MVAGVRWLGRGGRRGLRWVGDVAAAAFAAGWWLIVAEVALAGG
jgi:hypothetical protein